MLTYANLNFYPDYSNLIHLLFLSKYAPAEEWYSAKYFVNERRKCENCHYKNQIHAYRRQTGRHLQSRAE